MSVCISVWLCMRISACMYVCVPVYVGSLRLQAETVRGSLFSLEVFLSPTSAALVYVSPCPASPASFPSRSSFSRRLLFFFFFFFETHFHSGGQGRDSRKERGKNSLSSGRLLTVSSFTPVSVPAPPLFLYVSLECLQRQAEQVRGNVLCVCLFARAHVRIHTRTYTPSCCIYTTLCRNALRDDVIRHVGATSAAPQSRAAFSAYLSKSLHA